MLLFGIYIKTSFPIEINVIITPPKDTKLLLDGGGDTYYKSYGKLIYSTNIYTEHITLYVIYEGSVKS